MSDYESRQFGKIVQKLNRMTPDQKAIFDIGAAAAAKGREDIANEIRALNSEVNRISSDTTRRGIDKDYEFRKEAFEDEKKLKPLAHALGAVNLLSGAVGGYNRYRRGKREGDFYDQLLSNGMTTE